MRLSEHSAPLENLPMKQLPCTQPCTACSLHEAFGMATNHDNYCVTMSTFAREDPHTPLCCLAYICGTTHTESAPPCCAPRPSHDTHRNLAGLGARGRARRADASERKTTKFAILLRSDVPHTPVTALRSRKTKPRVPPAQARSDREYSRCSMRITCR